MMRQKHFIVASRSMSFPHEALALWWESDVSATSDDGDTLLHHSWHDARLKHQVVLDWKRSGSVRRRSR